MLRRLGSLVVGLAIIVPAHAAVPAFAHGDVDTSSATTSKASSRPAIERKVKLGHRPVRTDTGTKVRLTFEGRRGQLIHLARGTDLAEPGETIESCGGRILRTGGKVVRPWAAGFWRLPKTGTYNVVNKACSSRPEATFRVQVRRVVRTTPLAPLESAVAGANQDVTHLMPFRVGEAERAEVAETFGASLALALIRPDRTIERGPLFHTALEHGHVVRDESGPLRAGTVSPPGRYFLQVRPKDQFGLSVTAVHTATLDGPTLVFPAPDPDRPVIAHQIVFTGQAGQWVYPELTGVSGGAPTGFWQVLLREEFKPEVSLPSKVLIDCPLGEQISCGPWQLPSTGTYAMDLTPLATDTSSTATTSGISIRARTALVAEPLTVDGPAVTYTSATPGQWVVGTMPDFPPVPPHGGSNHYLTASKASASLTSWQVTSASGFAFLMCTGLAPDRCHLNPTLELNATQLSGEAPYDNKPGPTVAVLAVPPNVMGSLDLALTGP